LPIAYCLFTVVRVKFKKIAKRWRPEPPEVS
jgi:hypothetical protein